MTDEPNLEQLRKRAGELNIDGRTKLSRDVLAAAIADAEVAAAAEEAARASREERERLEAAAASREEAAREGRPPAEEPLTPAQTGRPELREVAEERAATRKPRRVIGEDPNAQEDN